MGAFSGAAGSQRENLSFGGFGLNPASGCGRAYFGTVNTRRFGLVELLIASAPFPLDVVAARLHSMFDCPDATHTSPTATSLNMTAFGAFFSFGTAFLSAPRMVKTPSVPPGNAASLAIHLPSLSALTACPSSRLPSTVPTDRWTYTSSPGSAVPQTGSEAFRWNTM